jgi:uncharacterized damage-inducible protein DinB
MVDVAKLVQYNTWANRRLVEQAIQFSNDQFTKELGGSFPSLRLTFLHLLETDWLWMHRWKGIPLVEIPKDWSTTNARSITAIWTPIQDQMEETAQALPTTPNKELVFTTRKGDTYRMPFSDLVMHVTNHGTYHRGQIVNMIRQLGAKPVSTDYFIFCT